ncbi:MAG: serine hydrolase domain-containing protein [Marinicellaceae bacterium]
MKLTSLTLFLLALSFMVLADTNTLSKEQRLAVDEIFSDWEKSDTPGCALGIIKDGQLIYARGYGMANLEYNLPNNSKSVFRIGSTSKQFTAASIVLLAEKKQLNLDDTLHTFFPDFPDYAKNITVRHLLNHTSGIRDYLTLSYLKGLQEDDFYTDKDVMRWLINQSELNFEPGEEYVYSNSGYWLLGQIVNQVAEMSMADFAKQEIFKPLGMDNTHFHNDHTQIVKNRASGYVPNDKDGFQISMTTLEMIGDGGIFTTIEDIKKWDDAYYKSETLSQAFWKIMTQTGKLNNGEDIDYASGLLISQHKGLNTVSHGGAFVGFRAELLRFPDQKLSVAIFANRGDANPSSMAYQVADVFLSDQYEAKEETSDASEIVESIIESDEYSAKQLVGSYELRPGMDIIVSNNDGIVHAKQSWNDEEYDLIKGELNSYTIDGSDDIKFTFAELKENEAQKIFVDQQGRASELNRKEVVDLSNINLNEFVGSYYSSELDVVYKISLDGDTIKLQIKNNDPVKLILVDKDLLSFQRSMFQFNRKNDQITDFVMNAGRAKNLKFVKQ